MMKKYILTIIVLFAITNYIMSQTPNEIMSDTISTNVPAKVVPNSPAGTTDYAKQLEEATKKKMELEQKKKDIIKSFDEAKDHDKRIGKELIELKNDIAKKQKVIKNQKAKLDKSEYNNLYKRKKNLLSLINKNKERIKQLEGELSLIEKQLVESNSKKAELDRIKNDVSTHLLSEYLPVIEQTFSKITIEELNQINEKCLPYTYDPKINELVGKVGNMIKKKVVYDEIRKTLDSPYQEPAVIQALEKVDELHDLTSAQKEEMLLIKKQLAAFGEGVKEFKEFIGNLNRCREGNNYTVQYFNDDKGSIFPDDLQQRINDHLLIVPYLKKKYEDFMKEFKKDPNKHSDIETEILSQ